MSTENLNSWLQRLGYFDEAATLHLRGQRVREDHPYALEIQALLRPDGAIRAQAVFDLEGVPTVVFLDDENGSLLPSDKLDVLRQRVWNQNLATVIIEVLGEKARVVPARRLANAAEELQLSQAEPDGPFSALDVASANLSRRLPAWFDIDARVDIKLLDNLAAVIKAICASGFRAGASERADRRRAELLMGQILFVSYLEHRQIVAVTYRSRRNVRRLHDLIANEDRDGLRHLIDSLRDDFNGDFLGTDRHDPWASLKSSGFQLLDKFLRRTDMETGQADFWNYDFGFIPVELLSGLYESFLSPDEQEKEGAYYTPRHLAMMAVDHAFADSADPLQETIFDGACGSGIFLTTAYRRLIGISEARRGRQLSFKERKQLLLEHIFGGDTNSMACRVTAFSLYLSLMEGLDPADIMEAQERERVKLPSLNGTNLHAGDDADFFSEKHAFSDRKFTLLISNPPWAEPSADDRTSADVWSARAKTPFVRRQIAGAYAIRALDFLTENGRVCLILPIPQFLAPTSASFVSYYLSFVRPKLLINFGDLQNLLFPTAENTCHLFLGERRPSTSNKGIPFGETFDYCVPKADLSLAFGRLTMQSADRHILQTRSVIQEPQLLVTLMWGDENDLAIWTRLSVLGTFGGFWKGPKNIRRWVCRKGVHYEDATRDPDSVATLRRKPFVPIAALRSGSPVLHPDRLTSWPKDKTTVVGLTDDLMAVFDGPRVLFPDGFSRQEQSVRAVYFDRPGTFNHSIGVVAGPERDASLLQFAAIYLRSSLARYFLMMSGWKMLCERNGIHLADVEEFPFFEPRGAPNPQAAREALGEVNKFMKELARTPEMKQISFYEQRREHLDNEVFKYFDLSSHERALVLETVEVLMPSIRPRSFKSLDTPAQKPARVEDFRRYAKTLAEALTGWRKSTGGKGTFGVKVLTSQPNRAGGVGVVGIGYTDAETSAATFTSEIGNQLVQGALSELRRLGLSVVHPSQGLQLIPDIQIWANGALYLVRLLNRKSWTIRQALRDAEQIVRRVQNTQAGLARPEVA